jgi:hypothetical protein
LFIFTISTKGCFKTPVFEQLQSSLKYGRVLVITLEKAGGSPLFPLISGGLMMNKVLRGAVVFLVALMAVSCKSTPDSTVSTGSDENSDEVLLKVYSGYEGIILDGAVEHAIKYGDTLTKLAREYYGEAAEEYFGDEGGYFFPLIMFASRAVVVDPDKIVPGHTLTIPDLRLNLENPISRSQLKSMLLDIAVVYNSKSDTTSGALKVRNQKDRDGLIALSRLL